MASRILLKGDLGYQIKIDITSGRTNIDILLVSKKEVNHETGVRGERPLRDGPIVTSYAVFFEAWRKTLDGETGKKKKGKKQSGIE